MDYVEQLTSDKELGKQSLFDKLNSLAMDALSSMKNEAVVPSNHTLEAHGVKGMKSTQWRKTFKHADHMSDWCEKNDAEVHGVRELEGNPKNIGEDTNQVDEAEMSPQQKMDFSRYMAGGMSKKDYTDKWKVGSQNTGKYKLDPTGVYHNLIKTVGDSKKLTKEDLDAMSQEEFDAIDEEQLDELSKQLLGRYINKASKDIAYKSSRSQNVGDRHSAELLDKVGDRISGVQKAVKKLTKEDTEQVDEARKIDQFENGIHKATVHKDSETGEYQVKFHTNGKHLKDADYFTDEKDDAIGTAKHQISKMKPDSGFANKVD